MEHIESNHTSTINGINLLVSAGLLSLGIVIIIYAFSLPFEKCNDSTNLNKKCLKVKNPKYDDQTQELTDYLHTLQIVSLVVAFIIIIPFFLNIIEYILKNPSHFTPIQRTD